MPKRSLMAGYGLHPQRGCRLPLLHGAQGYAQTGRPGEAVSAARGRVGRRKERTLDTAECDDRQPQAHLVALPERPFMARGNGCPYCANRKVLPGFNDLATAAPLVAKQWHETLNGALTPEMVTAGSHKKAWWICPYGHIWKATIYSHAVVQQCGCPVCAGRTKRKTK